MVDDYYYGELRESDGPDRFRSSFRCMEFWDETVGNLGGHYNCCCCEPCLYVRPFMKVWNEGESERHACCNCAPRVIYARFVPDDPEGDCCVAEGVPMFHLADATLGDTRELYQYRSLYNGDLFHHIHIRAELGQMCEQVSEYEWDCTCAWRIVATRNGRPGLPDIDFDVTIPVNHDTITCLHVPEVSISCVGPEGCPGTIFLEDVETARLPYVENRLTRDFMEHQPVSEYLDCTNYFDEDGQILAKPEDCRYLEFIELDPPCGWPAVLVDGDRWLQSEEDEQAWCSPEIEGFCIYWEGYLERWVIAYDDGTILWYGPDDFADGEPYGLYFLDPDCDLESCPYAEIRVVSRDAYGRCTQVCSRLQERRTGRGFPYNCLTWEWFDESYIDPYTGEIVPRRGWRMTHPANGQLSTLWLTEDDQRRCKLVPEFYGEAPGYRLPALIATATGCACTLEALLITPFQGRSSLFRCGFCTCWTHYCSTCRCVPTELCVMYFDGQMFQPNIILEWDAENHRWGGESDPLMITLSPNDAGSCELRAILPIPWTPPETWPTHECGGEFTAAGKTFDRNTHLWNFYIQGSTSDYAGNAPVWIYARSLTVHCDGGSCSYPPCSDECGGNPRTVTATLQIYQYDITYYDEKAYVINEGWCGVTMELHYHWEVIGVDAETGLHVECGYVGMYRLPGEGCPTLRIDYVQANISVELQYDKQSCGVLAFVPLVECDPFYATTHESEDPISVLPGGEYNGEIWPQAECLASECLGCRAVYYGSVYRVVISQ